MASIFDRDTLLDLTVNFIPLGIIAFFVALFLLIDPFAGLGEFGNILMIGLHLAPFVGLAILTYIAGKAIAGDEQRSSVFFQGQATMEGAQTKHEAEAEMEDGADLDRAEAAAADVHKREESDDFTTAEEADTRAEGDVTENAEEAGSAEAAGSEDADGAEAAAEAAEERDEGSTKTDLTETEDEAVDER